MEKEKSAHPTVNGPLDRLLQLVDEGNPDTILAEENLVSTFNDLLKYGLIAIEDERVYLTAEGKMAKEEGVEHFIDKLKQEQVTEEFNNQPKKTEIIPPAFFANKRMLWSLSLLLLVVLAIAIFLLNLPD